MKRILQCAGIALLLFLMGPVTIFGQQSTSEDRTHRSWSLEFRADRPKLYVHKTEQGDRIPYLYITYTLRNNYNRKLPILLNFNLNTGEDGILNATSNPDVEQEIISKEARLSGFSKGVRRRKITNLKNEGRYLTVDDLNRGFYLQHVPGEGLKQHEIQPLSIRSIGGEAESDDRIPYRVMITEGPEGRQGKPYDRRLSDHPAEIKGLLLFKGIDLDARELTLKVGGLMDPIVRRGTSDDPEPKQYRLEPRTLYLNWNWNVSRTRKRDTGPSFHGREMVRERFGPVVSRGTLRTLIDYLTHKHGESMTNGEGQELNKTLRGTALRTLRELTGQNYGYDPSAPVSENQEPIERWNEWWGRNKHDLLYILEKPASDGANQELFYQYPQPRYIVVKKRFGVSGAESPQELFRTFKSAWNEQRWQDVMDKLITGQRNKETLKKLFDRFGYEAEIGVDQNYRETEDEDRRIVSFKIGQEIDELQLARDDGEWFLSLRAESSDE